MTTEICINITKIMVCCLMVPSHYLSQCWLIKCVLCHSPGINFTGSVHYQNGYYVFGHYTLALQPNLPWANGLNNTFAMQKQCWRTAALPQIAKFTGPTWGQHGSSRPQMGPMLAPWTLLSGTPLCANNAKPKCEASVTVFYRIEYTKVKVLQS